MLRAKGCLLCKKHAVKTAQNKEESAFTLTPGLRIKYDAIKAHRNSDRHHKAVSQEQWQRMSIFNKEVVEKKEVAKGVLEKPLQLLTS